MLFDFVHHIQVFELVSGDHFRIVFMQDYLSSANLNENQSSESADTAHHKWDIDTRKSRLF